jgi:hypothetical protein
VTWLSALDESEQSEHSREGLKTVEMFIFDMKDGGALGKMTQ